MIPYFQWTHFHIGPVPIHIWGLMVSLGIIVGLLVSIRAAKSQKIPAEHIIDLGFWIILSALIGGRVLYVLSEISYYIQSPLDLFKIWHGGMSITGGFLGAVIAALIVIRIRSYPAFQYADIAIIGLPIGLAIGRLGCFFIFDHPGAPTSFFLGQEFLDGVVRHNHGLYLSINGLLLAIIFFVLWKKWKNHYPGLYSIVFLFWYGVVRFFLDFARAWDEPFDDSRFAHLTVAQYASILMVVVGGMLWYALYSKRNNVSHGKSTKKETS